MTENRSRKSENREQRTEAKNRQKTEAFESGFRNAELLDCGMEFTATRIQNLLFSVSFERFYLYLRHYALC
jgi:hypothetical protein